MGVEVIFMVNRVLVIETMFQHSLKELRMLKQLVVQEEQLGI